MTFIKVYLIIGIVIMLVCWACCDRHLLSKYVDKPDARDVEEAFVETPLAWIAIVCTWLPGLIVAIISLFTED